MAITNWVARQALRSAACNRDSWEDREYFIDFIAWRGPILTGLKQNLLLIENKMIKGRWQIGAIGSIYENLDMIDAVFQKYWRPPVFGDLCNSRKKRRARLLGPLAPPREGCLEREVHT